VCGRRDGVRVLLVDGLLLLLLLVMRRLLVRLRVVLLLLLLLLEQLRRAIGCGCIPIPIPLILPLPLPLPLSLVILRVLVLTSVMLNTGPSTGTGVDGAGVCGGAVVGGVGAGAGVGRVLGRGLVGVRVGIGIGLLGDRGRRVRVCMCVCVCVRVRVGMCGGMRVRRMVLVLVILWRRVEVLRGVVVPSSGGRHGLVHTHTHASSPSTAAEVPSGHEAGARAHARVREVTVGRRVTVGHLEHVQERTGEHLLLVGGVGEADLDGPVEAETAVLAVQADHRSMSFFVRAEPDEAAAPALLLDVAHDEDVDDVAVGREDAP
jgi:hypothetical protein